MTAGRGAAAPLLLKRMQEAEVARLKPLPTTAGAAPQPQHPPVKHELHVLSGRDDHGTGAQWAHHHLVAGCSAAAHPVLQAIRLATAAALERQKVELVAAGVCAVRPDGHQVCWLAVCHCCEGGLRRTPSPESNTCCWKAPASSVARCLRRSCTGTNRHGGFLSSVINVAGRDQVVEAAEGSRRETRRRAQGHPAALSGRITQRGTAHCTQN